MVHTPLCDLLGIDYPIVQAPIGSWSSPELVAAVCNAGGLGCLGTVLWPADKVRRSIERIRELTGRPFAVNHLIRSFDMEAFEATLDAQPAAIFTAIGDPGDLFERAHSRGILCIHQVGTVEQAYQAAERGADVVIAQGSEAGGFCGGISTIALLPQIVDALRPLPVLAAGGIADGRGLAAVLMLGGQGVNIGTRFVASLEAAVDEDWKRSIVAARSQDAIKVEFANDLIPPPREDGYESMLPRALRTPFIEEWHGRRADLPQEAARLRVQVLGAMRAGGGEDLLPFAGQSSGLISDILPAGQIVHQIVSEAEETLRRAIWFLGPAPLVH